MNLIRLLEDLTMSKKLYFQAILNSGSTKTYSLDSPKTNLSYEDAESAFNVAIDLDFFLKDSVKPTSLKTIFYQEVIKTPLN